MAKHKKFSAGLTLLAGLLTMSLSNVALALPETDVGSRPGIVAQAQSVESANAIDDAAADSDDVDTQAAAS